MLILTAKQIQLVSLIDAHVSRYQDTDRGDEQLFVTLYDYLDAFKHILDRVFSNIGVCITHFVDSATPFRSNKFSRAIPLNETIFFESTRVEMTGLH